MRNAVANLDGGTTRESQIRQYRYLHTYILTRYSNKSFFYQLHCWIGGRHKDASYYHMNTFRYSDKLELLQ